FGQLLIGHVGVGASEVGYPADEVVLALAGADRLVVDRDAGCDALVFLDPALVERVGEARTRARQVRLQVAVSAAVTGTATGAGGAAVGRARRRLSDGGRRRASPAGGGWCAVAAAAAGDQHHGRYHEQGDQRAESLP